MADENANKSSRLVQINIAVTLLLAILAGWSKLKLDDTEQSLKQVEKQVMKRDSERKDMELARINRESLEKKQFAIYDDVVKSLESDDPKRKRVAIALVTFMLEIDDPLRRELLAVIGGTGPADMKKVQQILGKESAFHVETLAPRAQRGSQTFNWEDFDYDVFWCESSGSHAKATAESIVSRLKAEGAKGRLRARLLPDSINARPGYQHSGFVVRFNAGEEKQANELARVGNAVLNGKGVFTSSLSAQSTPWYLSAFVCPAAP
jgi:hypothetical protein